MLVGFYDTNYIRNVVDNKKYKRRILVYEILHHLFIKQEIKSNYFIHRSWE